MQDNLDDIVNQSAASFMNINVTKTKEMRLGVCARKQQHQDLILDGKVIEKVQSYKLLGVHVTEMLKWDVHITAMLSKASKRIHFLKQLRRVCVSTADLVIYYNCVIRSVLEYACPVWHSSLTIGQSQEIERLQKRALRCILEDVSYADACSLLGLPSLCDCREQMTRQFFEQLKRPNSCLAHLMPLKRDISGYLRNARLYELPKARTVRYAKSFLPYCITHFT